MLKIANKIKKNEQLEVMSVIDKCTKIMKEDRLQLRQMVKDDNTKLLELVAKSKKKPDLNDLQTELRKFLKDKRAGQDENLPQPVMLRKVKSRERSDFGAAVRSPSRSHLDFRKKRDESAKRLDSHKKNEIIESGQLSHRQTNIHLEEIVKKPEIPQQIIPSELKMNTQLSETKPFQDDMTPIKLEFMTIVSQAPLSQSDQRSECVLKYNAAELQQYMEEDKHYVSKAAFSIPKLMSLSYRQIAHPEYKELFTDWKQLLKFQEPQYTEQQQHVLVPFETKESIIEDNVKSLEIRGVTPEELFTYLVHNRFTKRLNFYQLKENAQMAIPDALIDFDTLFKLADGDNDGWISLEELGKTLEDTCIYKEESQNKIKQFYKNLHCNVTKEHFIDAIENKAAAEILYNEIDIFTKGQVTYWELFNHFEELEKLL